MPGRYLEVVWQLGSASVSWIHCDKDGTRWVERNLGSLKHKCFQLLGNRSLYGLYLLGYH